MTVFSIVILLPFNTLFILGRVWSSPANVAFIWMKLIARKRPYVRGNFERDVPSIQISDECNLHIRCVFCMRVGLVLFSPQIAMKGRISQLDE
jgi:hypothetical protein